MRTIRKIAFGILAACPGAAVPGSGAAPALASNTITIDDPSDGIQTVLGYTTAGK